VSRPGPDRTILVPVLCAIGATLCFGGVPPVLRHLSLYLDPWTVNATRYSTAALFWLPYVVLTSRRLGRGGAGRFARNIWVAALIPTAWNILGQIGWAVCPYYAEASTIGFVIRSSFLFTVLMGLAFIPVERLLLRRPIFYVGAALGVGGVTAIFLQKLLAPADQQTGATGVVLIVVTAVFWGGYAVSVRRCLAGYPLRLAFGVICLYTSTALVLVAVAAGLLGKTRPLSALPGREWAWMLGSAMLGIALGHILLYRAIHGIGPLVTNGIALIQPFVTFAAAAAALGETMGASQLAGGLAVVAGGYCLVRARGEVDRFEGPKAREAP